MSNHKYFSRPSLERQVAEFANENSKQVIENNPANSIPDVLVIQSSQVDDSQLSKEGEVVVQNKTNNKNNKKTKRKNKKNDT